MRGLRCQREPLRIHGRDLSRAEDEKEIAPTVHQVLFFVAQDSHRSIAEQAILC